jgi:hypothetical protein
VFLTSCFHVVVSFTGHSNGRFAYLVFRSRRNLILRLFLFENATSSWITLVNATQSDLGSCLGLSTFSSLIVQGSEGSFATGVDTYLTGMCGGTKCSTETLKYWKYKIQGDCKDDMEQPLLKTLNVVMNSYETSLYDLACKVHLSVLLLVHFDVFRDSSLT